MIRNVFQLPGTVPLEIERLQRSVTSGATAIAVLLSIKAEVPSGLVALVVAIQVGEQPNDIDVIFCA